MKIIGDSYLLHSRELILDERIFYTSPFLEDPEYYLDEIAARPYLRLARFTLNEVMDAGDTEFPMPPSSEEMRDARLQLIRTGKSDDEAGQWLSQAWMILNRDGEMTPFIQRLLDNSDLSIDQLNRILSFVTDWSNNLPRWILKGNTSRMVFDTYEKPRFMKQPPQVVIGPNMKKMGINIPQEKINEIWKNTVDKGSGKIGRNAPCPCGSGKKFKNCCGKN